MNKICHITSAHARYDIRIHLKECVTLAQWYKVFQIVADGKGDEIKNDVNILDVGKPSGRLNRFVVTTFLILKKALTLKADLYHFHDPELMWVGFFLRIAGKRVIYDVHEDLPKDMLNKPYLKSTIVKKILAFLISTIEKMGDHFFSGIITVTPDISKRFNNKNKEIVKNYPILKSITDTKPVTCDEYRLRVVYAGGLTKIRGIRELVDAMALLDNAVLWLLGPWESEQFKEYCKQSPGWAKVYDKGNLSIEEVYSIMKAADIGITALHPTPGYLKSLPIKSYEYIACGLPVIMSDFPFWREIYKGAALYIDPLAPISISNAIQELANDKQLRENLVAEGRRIMTNDTFWESEAIKMKRLYDAILIKFNS